MVELGVDVGDVEAPGVEELREFQDRGDVALSGTRQAHHVRFPGGLIWRHRLLVTLEHSGGLLSIL